MGCPLVVGWAHVGLVPGEPVNRNKVLLDRFDECFQSKRSGAQLEEKPESKGSAVLDMVSRVVPKKEKCSNPNCRNAFFVTYRHCPSCGAENPHFDAQELMLSGPGKKSGWVKSVTEVIEPETDKERLLATSTTDWLSAVRKRNSTAAPAPCTPAPCTPAPGTPAPSTPAPKTAAPAPSTPLKTLKGTSSLQPAAGEQGPALADPAGASSSSKTKAPVQNEGKQKDEASEESPDDFDLESPEGAQRFLEAYWRREKRSEVRPVIQYFLSELKKESSKSKTMADLIQLRVTKPKILNTSQGRASFIAAWKANRSKRFAKHPQK